MKLHQILFFFCYIARESLSKTNEQPISFLYMAFLFIEVKIIKQNFTTSEKLISFFLCILNFLLNFC